MAAISALEKQRGLLGAAVVDPAIAELRRQLAEVSQSLSTQGERKLVTVMFADTSGFTALSEARDAEYVRNLMNDCFEQLVPVVERHGGTIDKFIGDAIMALFGAPIAREDDAARALNAALAMLETLNGFNSARGVEVGLHFGINTGEVIAGEIGSAGRRDYSVIGDAVNVAARLQDLSKRGEIFVGPETHRLTRNEFDFEALDAVALKGREAAVPIFRLIGHKSRTILNLRASKFDAPMVGREEELRVLVHAASKLSASGGGSAILIGGDAGVGKSRLITETRLTLEPDLFWVQGRAQSNAQNTSYATERHILLQLIGGNIETDPADVARMLLAQCRARIEDVADETYAHLAAIAGLPPDDIAARYTQSVSGEALKPRIAQAFLRFVKASAGGKPLALCFEDIHWVDQASIQLIRYLALATAQQSFMLMLTARSEALSELGLDDGELKIETLRLHPLDTKTSASLMRNFLKCETLPPDALNFIHERAEGNPFFLEELLRSLVETGALTVEDGRVVPQRAISDSAIPTTLQGIIMARLDRLPTGSKSTLQTASVIGRSFPLRLLAYVHDGGSIPPTKLHGQLKLLEDREFVRKNIADQLDQADREYVFQHAVTQEVVYGSLLEKRRTQIHLAIAETIESYFGDRSDEFASALALHFRNAGHPRKAAQYYLLAARRAATVFAHGEARTCYASALEMLSLCAHEEVADEDSRAMAEAHIGLGDVLEQDGEHGAAQAEYDAALALTGKGDAVFRALIHRKYGMAFISQRASHEALESYGRANDALETSDSRRTKDWWNEWIEVQLERMWAIYWMGDAAQLRAVADKLRDEVDLHGSLTQKSRYLKRVILISFREENLNISNATLSRAIEAMELARRCNDPDDLARAHFLIACCNMWRGDLNPAEADFTRALELVDHTGNTEYRVMSVNYLTLVHRKRSNLDKVREWAERSLAMSNEARMPLYSGLSRANAAWLALREDRLDDAKTLASETFDFWQKLPFQVKWMAAWPLVACHHARETLDQAADAIRIMLHPQQNRQPPEMMAALAETLAALEGGNVFAAQARLTAIMPMAKKLGYV